MPRLSRFQVMNHVKPLIIEYLANYPKSVFTDADLSAILESQKKNWTLPAITNVGDFGKFLLKNKIIDWVTIELPNGRSTDRYYFDQADQVTPYEIALSLRKNSYISHYSAVFLHGLTDNVPKTIYTNLEQNKHSSFFGSTELEQKNIDAAFSRPMRKTNQIAKFELNGEIFNVYLLNGQKQNNLGVITHPYKEVEIRITNIERTLIDITVRPAYCGGVEEVLNVYRAAFGRISVNRLMAFYKKMNFKYPYHQAIGFYMEKAGYPEKLINLVDKLDKKYNFYLTYQMKDAEFSDKWRVFYPKGLS